MTKLAENAPRRRRRLSMHQKQNLTGWAFLLPAALLIVIMSFYPMFRALLISFMRGKPTALKYSDPLIRNYQFMLKDTVLKQALVNTFTYMIIQVPIMLLLALIASPFLLLIAAGCGKKGDPVPQDKKNLFSWESADAALTGNGCLAIARCSPTTAWSTPCC